MKKTIFLLIILTGICSADEIKQTVCLNMIVKNESRVITRCLKSVKNFIDYWVIVDTGSTDGTQEIIKEFMKDKPGELREAAWVDFAYNRNIALDFAKSKADYVLFMDADDLLVFSENFQKPFLDKDSYLIEIKFGGLSYYRTLLINNYLNWKWEGVLHEVISSNEASSSGILKNAANIVSCDGARSQDPLKYQKDAEILEKALIREPNNARYRFYLAQSYRDCGNLLLAMENYQKRIFLGGWDEEVFYSMLQIAQIQQTAKMDPHTFIDSYFKTFVIRPTRLEPLYYLVNYYRLSGNYQMGYNIGKMGEQIAYPNDALFIEDWIYKYGFLLEFSICAYWTGSYLECKEISEKILLEKDLPRHVYECVLRNLAFAKEKLLDWSCSEE